MPYQAVIEIGQKVFVLTIGIITCTVPDYHEEIMKVVWTVISMSLGTVVSFYIKKFLNRKRKHKTEEIK